MLEELQDKLIEVLPTATALPDVLSVNVTTPEGTSVHPAAEVTDSVRLVGRS